jgi:hypothetical protein
MPPAQPTRTASIALLAAFQLLPVVVLELAIPGGYAL